MKRANVLRSPAPSFAESFATARTSLDDDNDDDDDFGSPSSLAPPSGTLAPPQSLRKSISVDSFAKYNIARQPESPKTPAEQHTNRQQWATRHRGESLGSVNHTLSRPMDTDGDRYDPLSVAATERYRRASLKVHEPPKLLVRAGDLPLPSRSQNNSISTTASALGAAENITPSSSRPTSFKLGSSRSRSGSLNNHIHPHSMKKIHIDPQLLPLPSRGRDVVLLVLGTSGCGKTTVIKGGLSACLRSEETIISENPRYVRRLGKVLCEGHSYNLQIIEGQAEITTTGPLEWSSTLPPIDGVILCYDSSKRESFLPIESLVVGYRALGLSVVVLGCKADLTDPDEIDPGNVLKMLKKHDAGLIQTSTIDANLKGKMPKSFDFILKAILRKRGSLDDTFHSQNPASPDIITKFNPLEKWSTTASPLVPPTLTQPSDNAQPNSYHSDANIPDVLKIDHGQLSSKATDLSQPEAPITLSHPPRPASPLDEPSLEPTSFFPSLDMPERSAFLGGLPTHSIDDFTEAGSSSALQSMQTFDSFESEDGRNDLELSPEAHEDNFHQAADDVRAGSKKEPKYVQWAKLDDLLDKLLFLAISGDDPTYATHFLLTYRRFATPRSLLLAMQKRMRQLDSPCGDPMFASFAQMRICHLLQTWIRDYPNDFAVKDSSGALNALVKSIISKTHLLHYGSDLLLILEQVSGLCEEDMDWALRAAKTDADSDDYNEEEEEDTRLLSEEPESEDVPHRTEASSVKVAFPRARKSSLPLPKALISPSPFPVSQDPSPKQLLKDLVKLAYEVQATDSEEIAHEITSKCLRKFLVIKPRDWLQFTFVSKKAVNDPIAEYSAMTNHIADWVISLILCHDRPKNRARQMEKFVDIAAKIRQLNNYSGLRAFVAGINIAADNATLEAFKQKAPEASKNLMSWDVLLRQIRSHRAYRMALRNSKGGCIPALEVHIQDLIKTDVGNKDYKEDDPSMIHWGKFNMMGRFICTVSQCQAQCRNSDDYNFLPRENISYLLDKKPLMSQEMQESRLNAQDDTLEQLPPIRTTSNQRDPNIISRLFFS